MKIKLSKRGDMAQGENGVPGWVIVLAILAIMGVLVGMFGEKIINWLKILIP